MFFFFFFKSIKKFFFFYTLHWWKGKFIYFWVENNVVIVAPILSFAKSSFFYEDAHDFFQDSQTFRWHFFFDSPPHSLSNTLFIGRHLLSSSSKNITHRALLPETCNMRRIGLYFFDPLLTLKKWQKSSLG